jgi:hypothetical protein
VITVLSGVPQVAYYFLSRKVAVLNVVLIPSVILQGHTSIWESRCFCSTDSGSCNFRSPPSTHFCRKKQTFLQWFLYLQKSPEYKLLLLRGSRCFRSTDSGSCTFRNPPKYTFLSQNAGASSVLKAVPILSGTMQGASRANSSDLYSRCLQFESWTG